MNEPVQIKDEVMDDMDVDKQVSFVAYCYNQDLICPESVSCMQCGQLIQATHRVYLVWSRHDQCKIRMVLYKLVLPVLTGSETFSALQVQQEDQKMNHLGSPSRNKLLIADDD